MSIREFVNRTPWLGWALAATLLIAGIISYLVLRPGQGTYSLERLSEDVTIRCAETGYEWTMPRGRLEADLLGRAGQIDPNEGIVNPQTGRPTGFPVSEWKQTVERLNAAKRELAQSGRRRGG